MFLVLYFLLLKLQVLCYLLDGLHYLMHTDIFLDGIVSKLECSVFYVKRAMNRVLYAKTSILGQKQNLTVGIYFWFFFKWKCEGLFKLFSIFLHSEKLAIYTFIFHVLTNFDILFALISINLLMLHAIACCVRSDI